MRRLVALVGLFIIVGGLLASCGPKAEEGGAPAPEPAAEPAEDAATEE